jgi:hypothetical protein
VRLSLSGGEPSALPWSSTRGKLGPWRGAMEVVEAAAAQLETLKFSVTGFGVGQCPGVPSPDSGPAPGPQPSESQEKCPGPEQDVEAQPPLSADAGGSSAPQPQSEGPPPGGRVTRLGPAEPAQTPQPSETSDSDSDSDSDRSSAYGSLCGRRGECRGRHRATRRAVSSRCPSARVDS